MKAFLTNHGEKLFLVAVALVAAWSLFASLSSLRATEHLPEADIRAMEKIDKELKTKKAPPKVVAPYGEWLGANLDGHGIYALTGGTAASPIVYEPPFMQEVKPEHRVVRGTIGLPGGLAAAPDRRGVTFSWTAPVMTGSNMKIVEYMVLRREEGGEWGTEPVYAGPATSFLDRQVSPETEYAYKVRAAGVPAPPDDRTTVKPMAPPLVRLGEVWLTAFAGDARAMTPSNIDFECSNVFERFGQKYANIVIKRWNNKEDKWDIFRTEPGIQVGNKVIGSRPTGPFGTGRETFDSGYMLKEIVDKVIDVEVETEDWVEDPPGSGNWVKKKVKKLVPKRVQEIVLEKEDGSRKLIVPVGKGSTTIQRQPKDKPKDAKPGAAPGGIDEMRKRFESSASASETERRPETAVPVAPATVKLEDARTSVRLTFPGGWTVSEDMAADLGVGAAGATLLGDGKVTVYKGTVAKSGVVIADKPLSEDEKQRLLGRGGKMDDFTEATLLATGLNKMDKETLPGIEMKGGVRTRNMDAGKVAGTYAFIFAEGQDKIAVTRYCATSPGHLYVLSFVCAEKDLASLAEVFDKIVSGWTW